MQKDGLLPKSVVPRNYRILLIPDFDDFTFNGEETIDLEVREPVFSITLNAADLEVPSVKVIAEDREISIKAFSLDERKQTLTVILDKVIQKGPAKISLNFEGKLNDQMAGFYRSKYTLPDGSESYMATTQFEAIDARRAFPCFDEPAFKATFELSLRIPIILKAISNMPIVSERTNGFGLKDVEFAKTPLMSTYLLAAMVGHFESISKTGPNGVKISVWTTPGKKEQGVFALETSAKILEFYNGYFGIPYPLPKLDLVAIPDFSAGAMENWGAITFRESALLVDPQKSPQTIKEMVAIYLAHEIAHMWFGNLVTMAWWDDLWLNEGFASFMEYKAVNHIFPEWDLWTRFVGGDFATALSKDGLRNTHPIETEISDPSRIDEQFDAISYSKSACVIRMLEDFLGEEAFRQGLRNYIAKYQYGNTSTKDLWNSLKKVSSKPVAKIMDTWTKQAGYPVLQVKEGAVDCVKTIRLLQERFLYEGMGKEQEGKNVKWKIPVTVYLPLERKTVSAVMSRASKVIYLPQGANVIREDDWLKINPGHKGFYRVCYDSKGWINLMRAIKKGRLHASDRAGLIDDAYAFLRSGHLEPSLFFILLEAYRDKEDNYTVWNQISAAMLELDHLLAEESFYKEFQKFGKWLFWPISEELGWEESESEKYERYQDILLRSLALHMMGTFDDEETLRKANLLFNRYLLDEKSLNPNIKALVFNLAAQQGDEGVYKTLVYLYCRAQSSEEKNRFLSAITCLKDRALLVKVLDFSLSPEVRSQDAFRGIGGVAGNNLGRDICWDFFKSNFDELMRRYGGGGFMLGRIIESAAGSFTTAEKANEVEEFFAKHPVPHASRTVQQAIETIRLRVDWLSRNRDNVAGYLNAWKAHRTS